MSPPSPLATPSGARPRSPEPSPLERAVAFVGAPYQANGRTPAGWDCWGLVAFLRPLLFDRPTPSWAEVYTAADVPNRATVERLITERLELWRPVECRPGAIALLTLNRRPLHVGLILEGREMIHVHGGAQTTIEPVDRHWSGRIEGFYDS